MIVDVLFILHGLICAAVTFSNPISACIILNFEIEWIFFYRCFEKITRSVKFSKEKKLVFHTIVLLIICLFFVINSKTLFFSSDFYLCASIIKNTILLGVLLFLKRIDFRERKSYIKSYETFNIADASLLLVLLGFKVVFEIAPADITFTKIAFVVLIFLDCTLNIFIKRNELIWEALKELRTQILIISRLKTDSEFEKEFNSEKIQSTINCILDKAVWRRRGFDAILREVNEVKKNLKILYGKNEVYKESRFEIACNSLLTRMRRDTDFSAIPQALVKIFRNKGLHP